MKYCVMMLAVILFWTGLAFAQPPQAGGQGEKIDSAAVARIRDEGMNRSQVMDFLSWLSDVYGPRLSGSPAYKAAAEWAKGRLGEMGLSDAHLEGWGPFGKGWTLRHYEASVIGRQTWPLISYPAAWSPSVTANAEIVYLDARADSTLEIYRGKLKGKFVLLNDLREIKPPFEPDATREADSTLLQLANADGQRRGRFRFDMGNDFRKRAMMNFRKMELCAKEGVAGILTESRGDGGNVFVQGASVPQNPDSMRMGGGGGPAIFASTAKIIPQISVGAEHYNRLVRMIQKGEHPKLDMQLDVAFNKTDSGYNIIAEIPGTDLKDQIVMIGGHFDSWHGGTGATDNGTGSAVCMEAMRILKALDLHPRRTIRIGLWDAEEYGYYGSRAYVTKHFATKEGSLFDPSGKVTLLPEGEKFDVYFNNDNGAGKVRGIYLQGNENVRPIFRSWLSPFADMGASTITISNTGGTDHQTFDLVGLPGFQFIQDELDYSTRTHHATMDVYDRVPPEDLKQAAVIMAAFAYNAAMRDPMIPRKTPVIPPAANR